MQITKLSALTICLIVLLASSCASRGGSVNREAKLPSWINKEDYVVIEDKDRQIYYPKKLLTSKAPIPSAQNLPNLKSQDFIDGVEILELQFPDKAKNNNIYIKSSVIKNRSLLIR